jgi:ribosomal protein RSM22 (predicted rRNA methylase)
MKILEEKIVKTLLGREAFQQFLQGNISKRHLEKYANLIKMLSESYVVNSKEGILKNMSEPDLATAYALYYLPINFFKLNYLFEQIAFDEDKVLKVLDYGAGPGTGTLAFQSYVSNQIEAVVYDKSEHMLRVGERLFSKKSTNVLLTSKVRDFAAKSFDLIILANALNEFSSEEEANFIKHLDHLLAENGVLLVLEPALKTITRNLMSFRTKLLQTYSYNMLFPCTHCLDCPMLKEADNWCHMELEGLDSRLVAQIDTLTGYNKHKIKFSTLIFQKSQQVSSTNYRVVDFPVKDKRGYSLKLCGAELYGIKTFPKDFVFDDGKKVKKIAIYDEVSC